MAKNIFRYQQRFAPLVALILICGAIRWSEGSEWLKVGPCQLKMFNVKTSPGRGYLRFDGNLLKANGRQNESETYFTIYTASDDNLQGIYIFEDRSGKVIATNQSTDSIFAKIPKRSISKYNNLDEVRTAEPNIMFRRKKVSGYNTFNFRSSLNDLIIIGFDQMGEPLPASQVIPDSAQSNIFLTSKCAFI